MVYYLIRAAARFKVTLFEFCTCKWGVLAVLEIVIMINHYGFIMEWENLKLI